MRTDIQLTSELNKGSTFSFYITLPIGDNSLLKNPKIADLELLDLAEYNLTILIADDNDINYRIASNFLSSWNVKSEHATDGKRAIELALDRNFDLILMDLQMPIMDGYTAAKEIRKHNKNVPIVAITASVLEEIRQKAQQAGMNDFVSKPMTPHELYSKITSNLNIVANIRRPKTFNNTAIESTGQLAAALEKMSFGDENFIRELIDLYIQNLEELEEVLLKAGKTSDEVLAENIIHKTKTTLSTLELHSIQATATAICQSIKNNDNSENLSRLLTRQCSTVKNRLRLLQEDVSIT